MGQTALRGIRATGDTLSNVESHVFNLTDLVAQPGIEPPTSWLPGQRVTTRPRLSNWDAVTYGKNFAHHEMYHGRTTFYEQDAGLPQDTTDRGHQTYSSRGQTWRTVAGHFSASI